MHLVPIQRLDTKMQQLECYQQSVKYLGWPFNFLYHLAVSYHQFDKVNVTLRIPEDNL